jgi:hypothetical protein
MSRNDWRVMSGIVETGKAAAISYEYYQKILFSIAG